MVVCGNKTRERKMEKPESENAVKTFRILELFSGIGGMRMALERKNVTNAI